MKPDSVHCPTCQSQFGDSNCVHFAVTGPNDPIYAEYILDDDESQLAECGPNGFGVFMPTWLSDPPAVSIYNSTPQTVPFDTALPLLFNRQYYDTDSMSDPNGEVGRITFNSSGVYFVTLNLTWENLDAETGDMAAFIRKNGSDYIATDSGPYGTADAHFGQSLSYEGFFDVGEHVEALAKQDGRDDAGDPLSNIVMAERYSPIFSATFLRLEP